MPKESKMVLAVSLLNCVVACGFFVLNGINIVIAILLATGITILALIVAALLFTLEQIEIYFLPNQSVQIIFDFDANFAFFNKKAVQENGVVICLALVTYLVLLLV